MTTPSKNIIALALALDLVLILFALDQAVKWALLEHMIRPDSVPATGFIAWLVATHLPRYDFVSYHITDFFNIVMVWNHGISFGLLAGDDGTTNTFLMVGLCLLVLVFAIWAIVTPDIFIRLILAVIIGGACGNLWDRVRFDAVADFFDFHAFGWHYPAFNIADSAIVLGVLALMIYEIVYRPQHTPRVTT